MTLARARSRLGGRAEEHGRAGEIVCVDGELGVVLWSSLEACDVWIGDDRTKRISADEIVTAAAPPGSPVASLAEDARAFGRLEEGQPVVVDGAAGTLVEKCRFGGLVARPDGKILAVGFRRFARSASS